MPCTRLISPNNMTANNAPTPYQALAESEFSTSNKAYQAFDGLWESSVWASSVGHMPTWLIIDLGSAKLCCAYGLRSLSVNYPKDWTFSGSNNGTDWTVLDTQTDQTLYFYQDWYGTIENETEYRYYKWDFTESSDTIIVLGEAKVYAEEIAGIRDVISTGCVPFERT